MGVTGLSLPTGTQHTVEDAENDGMPLSRTKVEEMADVRMVFDLLQRVVLPMIKNALAGTEWSIGVTVTRELFRYTLKFSGVMSVEKSARVPPYLPQWQAKLRDLATAAACKPYGAVVAAAVAKAMQAIP